jgi:hypothetical protein
MKIYANVEIILCRYMIYIIIDIMIIMITNIWLKLYFVCEKYKHFKQTCCVRQKYQQSRIEKDAN